MLVGGSFRFEVKDEIFAHLDQFGVVEVIVDHFLNTDEHRRDWIREVSRRAPIVAHGVGLSLGTAVQPDPVYLDQVARALGELKARCYSEHLAFTRVPGHEFGELLPVPRTAETAEVLIENIRYVRSFLDVPFHVENIARYFDYPDSEFDEAAFLDLLHRETGAGILLDVENLYANSLNMRDDADRLIQSLPPGAVKSVHLGGGDWRDSLFVDDHAHDVPDEALCLLRQTILRHQPDVIVVERDDNFDNNSLTRDVSRVRRAAQAAADESHGVLSITT